MILRRLLLNQAGFSILELLLGAIVMAFVLVIPIGYHEVMDSYDQAKAEMYRFLERMQVEGYLTVQDEEALYDAFEAIGCPITALNAPRESQGDPRVLRNPDPSVSTVSLEITYRPKAQDLVRVFGALVGGSEEEYTTTIRGSALSERVDP